YHPYCAITEELDELVKARASADAAMRGGCIVLALELHRLAQGHYPETLDALAPQFLSEVPADPFSEKPFVYKLVENDYLLYSAGANCLDDGGGLKNNDDLVIYAPADAADVKDLKEAVPPSVSEPVPSVEPPAEKAVPQPLPPPEPQPQAPPAPPQA
ncbi:MAG: hypothetical protein QG656_544, partial [Candidatus Hydrogenedentes bacterium]|nr:hypothetical protein [Candidatus Hydrogenedentota bacterium]